MEQNNPQFEEMRGRVKDAVAGELFATYDCCRAWRAWSIGTMDEEDFSPTRESDERLCEIADAAISAILPNIEAAKAKALAALDDADNLDTDSGHLEADKALCSLLESLGCSDVVKKYHKISKWYA